MSTIYIASDGYTNRKTFTVVKDQGEFIEVLWMHCTESFENRDQISDSRANRAFLTAMFKAHNISVYFTG